jgi:ribonucleotide monophosphatase NagD (HAD superfamily)
VATQVNRIARRDDGEHLDTGGWVRLLEYATGQTARVLGKPSPEFFLNANLTRALITACPRARSRSARVG